MSIEDVAVRLPGALAHLGDESTAQRPPRPELLSEPAHPWKTQRVSSTLEHAGTGLAEIDAEGRFLRVNSHLCGLMACVPDDLIGRSIFDETSPEDAALDRAQFHRQVAGEI